MATATPHGPSLKATASGTINVYNPWGATTLDVEQALCQPTNACQVNYLAICENSTKAMATCHPGWFGDRA